MANENTTKYYSSRQEKLVASTLGWNVVTGSGSRSFFPGDVEADFWLGECKTYQTPGHKVRFKLADWRKIKFEAVSKNKFPVLFTDDGSQTANRTWCMFPQVVDSDIIKQYEVTDLDHAASVTSSSIAINKEEESKSNLLIACKIECQPLFISKLSVFNEIMFGGN